MKIVTDVIDSIRYAVVMDGIILHTLYARPDDDRPWTGDVFAAKVMRYAPAQRAYFLDMGNGIEAFMPHKDGKAFAAGHTVMVCVERPKSREKNIRCSFVNESAHPVGLFKKGDGVSALAKKDFPQATETQEGLQGYDRAIIALNDKFIPVQNGLELVIEHTAAFTAVDINNANPDLKPFEANRLCMIELMRQMRLRNLSGQVIIDCLRLQNPEQRTRLQEFIIDEARADPRKVDAYGFTRLGLFELTRERNGLPLRDIRTL